ncbi:MULTISPECIES: hypothetical protein [unclassified Brevibacterium]|nr:MULTISPECIES: hypothetical protein [unclassified Brevibacterium]SMX85462.1 hypothetical protein BSP239C_01771 [Brevibacterium sp. 239c]
MAAIVAGELAYSQSMDHRWLRVVRITIVAIGVAATRISCARKADLEGAAAQHPIAEAADRSRGHGG